MFYKLVEKPENYLDERFKDSFLYDLSTMFTVARSHINDQEIFVIFP